MLSSMLLTVVFPGNMIQLLALLVELKAQLDVDNSPTVKQLLCVFTKVSVSHYKLGMLYSGHIFVVISGPVFTNILILRIRIFLEFFLENSKNKNVSEYGPCTYRFPLKNDIIGSE